LVGSRHNRKHWHTQQQRLYLSSKQNV